MADEPGESPEGGLAALVPELVVGDLAARLRFWCDLLGFQIAYQRPEDEFGYLQRGRAQVILEVSKGHWQTGEWDRLLGRGINFQILVDSLEPLLDALAIARWPLFCDPHEAWYRIPGHEAGQRQFLVQDPDGYMLRFAQPLGRRAMAPGAGGRTSSLRSAPRDSRAGARRGNGGDVGRTAENRLGKISARTARP